MGGARFLRGLSRLTDPRHLTVIGNTGDDEEFFGLHVSPDLDTVVYTLAGLYLLVVNPDYVGILFQRTIGLKPTAKMPLT